MGHAVEQIIEVMLRIAFLGLARILVRSFGIGMTLAVVIVASLCVLAIAAIVVGVRRLRGRRAMRPQTDSAPSRSGAGE